MTDVKERFGIEPGGGGPLDSLGFLLSQLGFEGSRRFHAALAPLGIDPRHFLLLRFVAREEGRSQQALGEMLRIPASRMVALVDQLEERGLLERRANPHDRRARALHVTPAGRRLMSRALKRATAHEMSLGTTLSDAERSSLVALLQKLAVEMQLTSGVHPGLSVEHEQPED
ncbi:MAG TPA: MarR family winged helix-turn-helix transcriptional regulator [Candidatus Angelobacter sp.]|nr:MarR family winged helix-turn-helix transcriptional regulator [Candidatus Angelobacter sp.]